MGIDVTSLSIKVTSEGIEKAADALEKLVVASDKVEKSGKTAAKSTAAVDNAQKSAIAGIEKYLQKLNDKVNLLGKSNEYAAKYVAATKTQDTALIAIAGTLGKFVDLHKQKQVAQQRDIELMNKQGRAYATLQAEAIKMNSAVNSSALKNKAINQQRDIDLMNQQGKAYAALQAEAIKVNAAIDSSALKNKAISQQRDIDLHNMQGKAYAASHAEALKMNKAIDSQAVALQNAEKHGSIFNNTLKSMAVAALAYLGIGFAKGIIEAVDSWAMMQARLKMVTGSMGDAKEAQAGLFEMAQKLRVPVEEVTRLYSRMAIPLAEIGKTGKEVMAMTEGLSLALKINGSTAAESASVMLQFSQAVAAGRLNGAEFNAVAEGARPILAALVAELRATGKEADMGSLKKMGADGKISVELMEAAIKRASPVWRKEFENLPLTVDGAMTRVKNAWTKAMGEMGEDTQLSAKISSALRSIEDAIPAIRDGMITAVNMLTDGLKTLAVVITAVVAARLSYWAMAAAEALTVAGGAARVFAGGLAVVRAAMSFLGGPIGIVVGLIAAGVAAWNLWGDSAKEAGEKAKKSSEEDGAAVAEAVRKNTLELTKEIELLQKRNKLREDGLNYSTDSEKLVLKIQEIQKGEGEYANMAMSARMELSKKYGAILAENSAKAAIVETERSKKTQENIEKEASKWLDAHKTRMDKKQEEIESIQKFKGTSKYPEMLANIEERYKSLNKGAKALTQEQQHNNTVIDEAVSKYKEYVAEYDKMIDSGDKRLKSEKWLTQSQSELNAMMTDATGRYSITDIAAAKYKVSIAQAAVEVEKMTIAEKANQEAIEEKNKAAEKAQDTVTKDIEKLIEYNQKLKDEIETFGMTKGAIQELMAVREESILLTMQEQGYSTVAIHNQQQKINLLREEGSLRNKLAGMESQKKASEEALADWNKTVEKYEDIFRKGFMDMLATGKGSWKSFTQSIVNTFKTTVADQIYKMFVKPIVLQLIGNVAGVTGGVTGAANTANSFSSLASGASTVANAFSAGSAMAGGSLASIASGSTYGTAFLSEQSLMLAAQEATGATAAGLSGMSSISSAIAAIPGWGWAALAAAAVAAYLLEDGPEDNTRLNFASNNAAGNISINERGNEGRTDSYIGGFGTSQLGTFGVSSTFWMEAQQETVQAFIKTVSSVDDALSVFMTTAEKLSVSNYLTSQVSIANTGAEGTSPNANGELDKVFAERIASIFEGLDVGMSKFITGFTGTSQQLATEAAAILDTRSKLGSLTKVFGEEITLDMLSLLRKESESFGTALTRITNTFQLTTDIATLLGKDINTAFGAVGLASEASRERLVTLAGGLNALGAGASFFAQNFYSEAERLKPVVKSVNEQLAAMGYAGLNTRAGFKTLVEGLNLANEADAKRYTQLMALAPAFAQVFSAEEKIIEATPEVAESVEKVVTSVKDIISAFKDAAKTYESAVADVASARKAIADNLMSLGDALKGFSDAVVSANSGVEDARNNISSAYFAAQDEVANAQQAITNVYAKAADAMKKFSYSIDDFLMSLKTTTMGSGSPESRLAALKEQFTSLSTAAMSGDSEAQGQLLSVAKDYLVTSKEYNASGAGFTADESFVKSILSKVQMSASSGAMPSAYNAEMQQAQAALAAAQKKAVELAELAKTTGANTEKNTYYTSENTKSLLTAYNNAISQQAVAQANYQQALELTKGLTVTVSDSMTGLKSGIDAYNNSVTLLATAANNLALAATARASAASVSVTTASGANDTAAGKAVMEMYSSIAGRSEADAEGFAYWLNAYNTHGAEATRAGFQDSVNQINGSHAGGLDSVPFDGYIAELHKGEQVKTAAAVVSTEESEAAMVALTKEILQRMTAIEMHTNAANQQRAAVAEVTVSGLNKLASKQEATTRKIATT